MNLCDGLLTSLLEIIILYSHCFSTIDEFVTPLTFRLSTVIRSRENGSRSSIVACVSEVVIILASFEDFSETCTTNVCVFELSKPKISKFQKLPNAIIIEKCFYRTLIKVVINVFRFFFFLKIMLIFLPALQEISKASSPLHVIDSITAG